MFWSKLCNSTWNCAWNLAFPVFISPIVWNMCENLHYELVCFKELHNDQEYCWPTIYRAEAAVVSTITSLVSSSTQCNKDITSQLCIPRIFSLSMVPENVDQSLCRVTFPLLEVHAKQIWCHLPLFAAELVLVLEKRQYCVLRINPLTPRCDILWTIKTNKMNISLPVRKRQNKLKLSTLTASTRLYKCRILDSPQVQ